MNDYTAYGFADREAYLASLCKEFDREMVFILADSLGPSKDFDGLVKALETATEECEREDAAVCANYAKQARRHS